MKAGTWGGGDSSAASALPSDGRWRFEARRNRLLLFITITFSVEVSLCRVVGRPLETISVRQLETHPEVVKRRKVCISEEAVWNHSAAARPFSQGRMGSEVPALPPPPSADGSQACLSILRALQPAALPGSSPLPL